MPQRLQKDHASLPPPLTSLICLTNEDVLSVELGVLLSQLKEVSEGVLLVQEIMHCLLYRLQLVSWRFGGADAAAFRHHKPTALATEALISKTLLQLWGLGREVIGRMRR